MAADDKRAVSANTVDSWSARPAPSPHTSERRWSSRPDVERAGGLSPSPSPNAPRRMTELDILHVRMNQVTDDVCLVPSPPVPTPSHPHSHQLLHFDPLALVFYSSPLQRVAPTGPVQCGPGRLVSPAASDVA